MRFNIKDKVRFELGTNSYEPRWNLGNDKGASNKYGEGEVISIGEQEFRISFLFAGKKIEWRFSYADQYYPGFAKLIPNEEQKKDMDALNKWLEG